MANRISEDLFQAIDVIIGQRLRAVEKDKTILCTVEDNKYASEGKYTVSNASARFEAFGNDTSYRIGQNVWVLIPDGDYNNDKIIISKYAKDNETPFVWVDPMSSFANITQNVLVNTHDFTEGILANYSVPRDIFTGQPIISAADESEWEHASTEELKIYLNTWAQQESNWHAISGAEGLDRIGISADFKTAFGATPAVSGNYGIVLFLKTELQEDTHNSGEGRYEIKNKYFTMTLDTADMWGDPYNYLSYFEQAVFYDFDQGLNGVPVAVAGWVYQMYNFMAESTEPLPIYYQTPEVNTETNEVEWVDAGLLDPNIFIQNISLSFGYSVDKVQDDTIFLFTRDNINYVVDNTNYQKRLQARFVYVDSNTTIAINSQQDLEQKLDAIPALAELHPIIRWYRYDLSEGVSDPRAGDFWQEFEPVTGDMFHATVGDFKHIDYEKFKCILCYNTNYDYYANNPELAEEWAQSDQLISSEILTFTNKDSPFDTNRDFIQGLKLTPNDRSNGVFNVYAATYGANSSLIDPLDEHRIRSMKASFRTVDAQDDEIDSVTRLLWYIPKRYTMIKSPNPEKLRDNQTLLAPLNLPEIFPEGGEERELINQRADDYYIILEEIEIDPEPEANIDTEQIGVFDYWIKPEFHKHYTNNTILVSAYRYGRVYEGVNASYELKFGVKGTNGTDYTLLLSMEQEIDNDEKVHLDPPAWTFLPYNNTTPSKNNTAKMMVSAQLFKTNDIAIDNVDYEWEIVYPPNGVIPTDAEEDPATWELVIDEQNNTWLQPARDGLIANFTTNNHLNRYMGVVLKCTATMNSSATDNTYNKTNFSAYLTIPMRRTRDYWGMSGPSVIRYDASGLKPDFYDAPYGIFDNHEDILYNYTVTLHKDNSLVQLDVINQDETFESITDQYFPVIKKRAADDKYHLAAKAMYYHDVNYIAYIRIADNGAYQWAQPLLILVDPYGNKFLNNWGGKLNIDYDNNSVMSAIMGAGKKENDNTFTGIMIGDLPTQSMSKRSGIVGYEHGEPYYQLYDDSTITLGKSSRAQLKFDGSESTIQNGGYATGTGIKIDFDGNSQNQRPYIDILSPTGSKIHLGTDSTQPYLQVRGTTSGKDLIHIANNDYYLQTNDYEETDTGVLVNDAYTSTTVTRLEVFDKINPTASLTYATSGLKINLGSGDIQASDFDLLATKSGSYADGFIRLSANANAYPLNINNNFRVGWDGSVTAKEFNFLEPATGVITSTGIQPKWMTFVTDVDGAILKGPAPVRINVTVSDTIHTTTTVTRYITTSATGTIHHTTYSSSTATPFGINRPRINDSVTGTSNVSFGDIVHDSVNPNPVINDGVGEYAHTWTQDVTVTGLLQTSGTRDVDVDVSFEKEATGETTVPVVQGIKLKITKINMWALTNDVAVATTTAIPIYDSQDESELAEYENF